jgi:hypothetical protein
MAWTVRSMAPNNYTKETELARGFRSKDTDHAEACTVRNKRSRVLYWMQGLISMAHRLPRGGYGSWAHLPSFFIPIRRHSTARGIALTGLKQKENTNSDQQATSAVVEPWLLVSCKVVGRSHQSFDVDETRRRRHHLEETKPMAALLDRYNAS